MRCSRCRGCMIRDRFMDLLDDTGQVDILAWRCLNCGEVLDGVVMNHRLTQQPSPYRSQRRWARCVPADWPESIQTGADGGSTT